MAWLRTADLEVKRDMEISRDEVRVMTVHGAKGLEAPVVFLADTTTSPQDTQRVRLIRLPDGKGGEVMVWAVRKNEDPPAVVGLQVLDVQVVVGLAAAGQRRLGGPDRVCRTVDVPREVILRVELIAASHHF
jgi:hypothetical protein